MLTLNNSYLKLGSQFYQRVMPAPISNPNMLLFNRQLAEQLKLPSALLENHQELTQVLAGNIEHCQLSPIALAYAGHQFGQFNPQLGDGRAHLLGDLDTQHNTKVELQLKGSGQTPFSRQGDGKCALGPAIREYLMGEAMHALGVPTTRSLSVVITNQTVYRQQPLAGAVVSRIASSHLRVGSMQYFAARGDYQSVEQLVKFAIDRHFPNINVNDDDYLLQFLTAVIARQVDLQVHWLRVGFIHGVMNTDNTTISGETIDYGPCAMLGHYDPATVYSSIDQHGRYAFGRQASICQWNMARLAETLLPLIDSDSDLAIERVSPIINNFAEQFNVANNQMMVNKLGFSEVNSNSLSLVEQLLSIMQVEQLDYTASFYHLSATLTGTALPTPWQQALVDWLPLWHQQLADKDAAYQLMRKTNPVVIPRNHIIEQLIEQSYTLVNQGNDTSAHLEEFLAVVKQPYTMQENTAKYQQLPADSDQYYRTFCGT